jgi:hypothetical protein
VQWTKVITGATQGLLECTGGCAIISLFMYKALGFALFKLEVTGALNACAVP